jgi:hypothetical protein
MRRFLLLPLVVLLPLLAIAGCDEVVSLPPGPPPPPGATAEVTAAFPRGGLVDTIVVNAVDRLPLRSAELVAPDGSATPASYIDVAASPRFATGQRAAGNSWQRSFASGVAAPALAIGSGQTFAAVESREQLLANFSTADIPLPDPVVYRRDWARYRIRLTFGTPPGAELRELPAPAPPPR